ncbi:MAG: hypothetical protein D6711_14920 [Chloroflexi bacterium]|nr:MAG: hypothetical protein D6711_14920 [Chloroflexota bacterium]
MDLRKLGSEPIVSDAELKDAVDLLCRFRDRVDLDSLEMLCRSFGLVRAKEGQKENLDRSLVALMEAQIRSAESLRAKYYHPDGTLRDGVSGRDAKEALQACQTVIKALQQEMEKMRRQDRLMKIERALIKAGNKLDGESKRVFTEELKEILEEV